MKTYTLILISISILFAPAVNAAIIDNDEYTTIDGLDWLDLSLTDGKTLGDAFNLYSDYRVATEAEYQSMWANFDTFGDDEIFATKADRYVNFASSGYEYFKEYDSGWSTNEFFNLFGITNTVFSSSAFTRYSYGIYSNGPGYQLGGIMVRDYYNTTDELYSLYDYNRDYSSSLSVRDNSRGFFLVRDAAQVSEPSILALMFIGLTGLGILRKSHLIHN